MFLRNFYNMLACFFFGFSDTTMGTGGQDGSLGVVLTNGTFYKFSGSNLTPSYNAIGKPSNNSVSSPYTWPALMFGTGTTPPTFDDYKLENIISSGIKQTNIVVPNPVWDSENRKWVRNVSCDITNTSSEVITVTEVGISGNQYLAYREVLENPVTIQPGERVEFKHVIEFAFPTV